MADREKLTLEDLILKKNKKNVYIASTQENIQDILREEQNNKTENEEMFLVKTKLPRSEFEKNILNAMKTDKNDFLKISDQKSRIAEFDKKMKRIKRIKSRKYRKHLKIARKKTENPLEIPNFLLQDVNEKRKEKVFYDEKMTEKVGKIMKIQLSDESESTDSECELMKMDSNPDDEHLKLFTEEKRKHIEENAPKDHIDVLPGWGAWGGNNLETKKTKVNTIETHTDGIAREKRKDFKMSRVLINEQALKNNIKVDLPYGFTKTEYEAWLNVPVSRESYSHKIFNRFLKKENKQTKSPIETLEYKSNLDKYE